MRHIVIIKGSVRPHNFTSLAVNVLIDEVKKDHRVSYQLINPNDYELPFPGQKDHPEDADKLISRVKTATGVIIATPEYHGSFSSMIKLIIENLGYPSALAQKPIGLLGVANGDIGAVKALEHLRSVCSHVGGIVLPGPVSIAHVREAFDEKGNCINPKIEQRIRNLYRNMIDYIDQFIYPKVNLEDMVRNQ